MAAAAPAGAQADVLVIGAGISGLSAAMKVRAAGRSVIVLEAMPRVGGRLLRTEVTTPAGGKAWIDLGGQWVGDTQTRALELVKRLNITVRFLCAMCSVTVTSGTARRCALAVPTLCSLGTLGNPSSVVGACVQILPPVVC
jgi:monoamine oxidase